MMRRIAFVVMILGMFALVLFLNGDGREISNEGDLAEMEENERVVVGGRVAFGRVIYEGTLLLVLDSGVELVCECTGNFEGMEIEAVGRVESYNGKKQIRVERIFAK